MGESLKKYLPWIIRGVVLLVFLVLAWSWNAAHAEREKLRKQVETLELEKKGLLAEREVKQKDLDKAADALVAKDKEWREHVKELEKILGEKPQVVRVVEYRTTTVPVEGPPEVRPCPTDNKKIVLVEGDEMHAELKEVDYGTDQGNTVVTGRISCLRDTPSPMVLHTEVIRAPGPKVLTQVTPEPYRWGAGAFVSMTKTGWAAGPKLLFPPFDMKLFWLFPMRIEAEMGVALGSNGEHVVQLGAGARFR